MKIVAPMIPTLFTVVLAILMLSVSAGIAPVVLVDPDCGPDSGTLVTVDGDVSAFFLPFGLLLHTTEEQPSCETCRRYLGFVTCTQHPQGIPRVYIRGEKGCSQHHERNDVTD